MSMAQAFAAAAGAADGVGNMVRAADASSLTRDEIEHMESLEVENSGEIEMNGIMYAIERMGEHWEVLTSARHAGDVVMTGSREEDTRVYKGFRSRFPTMSLESITEDQLKDTRMHETWRDYLGEQEGRVPEHNMISLLRKNCCLGYDDANTMLVPKSQFLCIEIARNREGVNDSAVLRAELLVDELMERKVKLKVAISEPDLESVGRQLRALSKDYPLLSADVLKRSGIGRFIHTTCITEQPQDSDVHQQAKALETQWRSGVVLSSLKSCPEASVAQAAAYVIENWQGSKETATIEHSMARYTEGSACEQSRLEVGVSAEERAAQQLSEATIQGAADRFAEDGVLYVESALNPQLLAHTRAAVDGCCEVLSLRLQQLGMRYAADTFTYREVQYRDGARLDNRLLIGDSICGSALVASHPLWFPIVDRVLGGDANLLFSGVVEAYPFDRPHAQEWHRDGQALSSDPAVQLGSHCINVFIPLVDITDDVGPTEFWVGTHVESTFVHLQNKTERANKTTPKPQGSSGHTARILAPAGSVVVFDYRTIHRGSANYSGRPRRVLYLTFARKWFTDAKNFNAPSILTARPCVEISSKPGAGQAGLFNLGGGMESFYHVLMLHQLGQNCSELMATQRSVGHARYTTEYGQLLALAFLANQQRAFAPYTDHAASASAVAALQVGGDWTSLLAGEDEAPRRHDVMLLQNMSACLRLLLLAPADGTISESLSESIAQFVGGLSSPSAQQDRIDAVDAVFTSQRRPPTGDFTASKSFRGGFPGYAFGCGTSGLGYYTDAGGAVMSAEIRAATDLYSKNAPPVKERMPEPAAAASASAAAAESVSVSELQSAVGKVQLGQRAVVCWEDGMEYEAEVISMVTNAVRWLYSSSAAWDAWEETIPLDMFEARGVVLGEVPDNWVPPEPDRASAQHHKDSAAVAEPVRAPSAPVAQAEAEGVGADADFGESNADSQASARLEQLSLAIAGPVLRKHGFTLDRGGWQLFVACAKAAALAAGEQAAAGRMEEAVTGWFHGGQGRFELVQGTPGAAAPMVVVVFSSLGNGLIRPEFRGSLLGEAVREAGVAIDYDVLFVLDPAMSWYCQDPGCSWAGFGYYQRELRTRLTEGGYKGALLLGDSMGGSAALMFSASMPAAVKTRCMAFVPQVDVVGFSQANRADFTLERRRAFEQRLLANLAASTATVTVHVGVDEEDERQIGRLAQTPSVQIVRHSAITGHHVSSTLKQERALVGMIQAEIAQLRVTSVAP